MVSFLAFQCYYLRKCRFLLANDETNYEGGPERHASHSSDDEQESAVNVVLFTRIKV